MNKKILAGLTLVSVIFGCKAQSTVYFTDEITPEALVKIYETLGVPPTGKVAVKISTGESEKTGYLRPDFIAP